MSRVIPNAERIERAHALIQKAREVPVPVETGKWDLNYLAQVKSLLREARELVQFIPNMPSASAEMKAEVKRIYEEAERANHEILN
jgi:hypothetical protein